VNREWGIENKKYQIYKNMGKKRIVTTEGAESTDGKVKASTVSAKKRVLSGVLHVQSTYNNTKVLLTDTKGNALFWGSSGASGFRGAKKGTPFAAAKVGETLALKALNVGLKEIDIVVKGVGSGRESAIRGFISKGVQVNSIKDMTPVPMNGPKPKKPRRV
jgi:small subunit ribosomal protein S11